MVECLWKNVCQFFKKKKELPYIPAILLLVIYPKLLKAETSRDISIAMPTAALFMIAKRWKQLKCPPLDQSTKHGLYIQWNIVLLWKERKF